MAKREPGFYDPASAEERRIFDGGEDEFEDEGSSIPMMLVVALVLVAAFGALVYYAYKRGVVEGQGAPKLIAAETSPLRTAPANPGGATPYQGLKVYSQRAPADDDATPAAKPLPNPNAEAGPLLRQAEAAKPAEVSSPDVAKPVQAPRPVEAAPQAAAAREASAPPAQLAAPKASPSVAAAPKEMAAKPVTAKPVTAKPVTKPAAQKVEANAAPAAESSSEAKAAPKSLIKPAVTAGTWMLQIGAYKSEADASTAWSAYAKKHKAAASFSPDILRVDLGDKGVWFRLRVGSYADKAEATAACDALKADGAACFPAKG